MYTRVDGPSTSWACRTLLQVHQLTPRGVRVTGASEFTGRRSHTLLLFSNHEYLGALSISHPCTEGPLSIPSSHARRLFGSYLPDSGMTCALWGPCLRIIPTPRYRFFARARLSVVSAQSPWLPVAIVHAEGTRTAPGGKDDHDWRGSVRLAFGSPIARGIEVAHWRAGTTGLSGIAELPNGIGC